MNRRKFLRFLVLPLIALLLCLPPAPPLPAAPSAPAGTAAAAALLRAPHAPAALLVKIPAADPAAAAPVAAGGRSFRSARGAPEWPQGVLSATLLFHAPGGSAPPAIRAAAYDAGADTEAYDSYLVAADAVARAASFSLAGSPASGADEPGDWYMLRTEEDSLAQVLAALLSDPAVLAAEPDYLISAAPFTRSEPQTVQAAETAGLSQYHLAACGIPEGLSRTARPGDGVLVAVVDSGVDINHPDLSANIDFSYPGRKNFTAAGGADNVSDGYGHGTMVAGLIAANGLARGVAPYAKIIPIKVLDNNGGGSTSDLVAAINAVRDYADVINLSLGGMTRSAALEAAVRNAWQANCLIVSSAGNEGLPNGPVDGSGAYAAIYPAASPGVVGVMAAGKEPAANGDRLASFSNWDVVPDDRIEYHIMAPGAELQSTAPGNRYRAGSGTSFAAPLVSGMAAVTLSALRESEGGRQITNAELFSRVAAGTENVRGKTVAGKTYSLRQARLDKMMINRPALALIIDESSLQGELTAGGAPNSLSLEIFTLRGETPAAALRLISQTDGVRFEAGAASLEINPGSLAANSAKTVSFNVFVSPETANGTEALFSLSAGGSVYTLRKTVTRLTHISGDLTAGRAMLDSSSVWVIGPGSFIPAGKTLTVAPGTELRFNAALVNDGVLKIEGAPERPVAMLPGSGYDRVTVYNGADAASSVLSYVKITNPELRVSSIDHAYWSGEGTAERPLLVEAASVAHSQVFDFRQGEIRADLAACSFSYLAGVAISGGSFTDCVFMNNIPPSQSQLPLTSLDLTGRPVFLRNAVLTPLNFKGAFGAVYDLRNNYFDLTHSAFASASDFNRWDELAELAPGCTLIGDPAPNPSLTAGCPPFILYAGALPARTEFSDFYANQLILTFNTDMTRAQQPELELLYEQNASLQPVSFYDKRAVSGEWIGPRAWRLTVQTDYPAAFVSAAGLRAAADGWIYTAEGERRLRVNLGVVPVSQSVTLTAAATAAGVTLNWEGAGSGLYTVYRMPDGEEPQNMGGQRPPWPDPLSGAGGGVIHYYVRAGNIVSNIVTVGDAGGGTGGGGTGGSGTSGGGTGGGGSGGSSSGGGSGGGGGGGGGGALPAAPLQPGPPAADPKIIAHISGADRVQTSVLISRRGWDSAAAVVIAPGAQANLIDALAAAPLAGQENAPVLLSVNGVVAAEVTAEIKRLGAGKIYAVGALGQSVVSALSEAFPAAEIVVLRGQNRLETALLINARIKEPQGVFVVGYNGLPDALSAAPFAVARRYVLLPAAPDGSLPANPYAPALPGYILGGPALTRDIPGYPRLYGPDRYATNIAVLNALPFDLGTVYTANGQTLVDALTGSALAAQTNSPVLLTPGWEPVSLPASIDAAAARIYVFGG